MSAVAVQAAIVAALTEALGADVSGVFDGVPADAVFPFVSIEEGGSADWSFKGARGREQRFVAVLRDDGASAARLHGLMARAEFAIEGVGGDLGVCRVASVAFLRARVVRPARGAWAGVIEFRVRWVEG
ncbi:DUF3168 domain-containing protein [Sphingomonas naphthae]|uniref:DUF3168 domain-containing protein n=1 Tax=Sphingomonas naphthae TaxID=1813468 RepID=A0ABY7TMP2_9SPHN|nr:DUF3168 domain-containing protein [Sphingomonas naphthae]WCT73675.1 DUF3168 domain-containing protein [Sphingomonas naphthae]